MGKTKRNASRWMESRFKLGDTQYPEENETHYFNGRYQNKMRNGNRSYYSMEIDPLSYKIISWRDYGNWAKRDARQAARHNAKLMVIKLAHTIMDELWQDDDWYDDHPMSFDFSYSDEAYDDAEQRRIKEEQNEYWNRYDPYEDWDY